MITNNTTQESSVDEKILKRREAIRRSYHKNKEKRSARAKERYKANKQKRALHYSENKEKIKAEQKAYREKNRESRNAYSRKYREKNKEQIREANLLKYEERTMYAKQWYQENRERVIERTKEYSRNNKDKKKKWYIANYTELAAKAKQEYKKNIEWYKDYRKKNRAKSAKRQLERYCTDIQYKLKKLLRARLYNALRRKNAYKCKKTLDLLGCDLPTLKAHIELQFVDGMSWDNYNHETWHIDHIKPCNTFDLTDPEQQKQCFHYTNLRPLWAKDNLERPKDGRDVLSVDKAT